MKFARLGGLCIAIFGTHRQIFSMWLKFFMRLVSFLFCGVPQFLISAVLFENTPRLTQIFCHYYLGDTGFDSPSLTALTIFAVKSGVSHFNGPVDPIFMES